MMMFVDDLEEYKEYINGARGFVEANSFECHSLWKENEENKRYKWKNTGWGLLRCVGFLAENPVCVSFLSANIDGHLIVFYHPTSNVVDHMMIEKFIEENAPDSCRLPQYNNKVNKTDAMNFCNVMHPLTQNYP